MTGTDLRARRSGAMEVGVPLTAVAIAVSLWSAAPAVSQGCGERTAAFSTAFDGLPKLLERRAHLPQ